MNENKEFSVREVMSKARSEIEVYIDTKGVYAHNIIGLTLSMVAGKIGKKHANTLVRELDLECLFDIAEVQE